MSITGLENPATPEELERILRSAAFRTLAVVRTPYWRVFLNRDQRYLGRCYAWYLGGHADLQNAIDLPSAASKEFWERIAPKFSRGVTRIWGATHVNYAYLGNETHIHRGHAHWHLIPRYFNGTPKFFDTDFGDQRIGRNYTPREPLILPEAKLIEIRDVLRSMYGP